MINEVRTVRDRCLAHTGGTTPDLQCVTNVFEAFTSIDKVFFVGYKSRPENTIIGQFLRWEQSSPYGSAEICVEIRYARLLEANEPLKRLVVCKELCHALDATKRNHSTTDNAIDNLAASFSLQSASQRIPQISQPFRAEMLAEISAYEILCPSAHRQEMMASGEYGKIGVEGVAAKYCIPADNIDALFSDQFLRTTLGMFP